MEIKRTTSGWLYNGNIFADLQSAEAAQIADRRDDPLWASLDLHAPIEAKPELVYDGLNQGTSFGTFVTLYLRANDSSIVALAKKIEVSKQTMFDWMNARSIPSANHAKRIVAVMGCSISTLEKALQDNFQRTKDSYFEKLRKA